MKKSIRINGLLSMLLLAVGGVHAAGLGRLSVQSALGQPLRAEIELLSVSKEELPGVSARLASPELFRQARLERSGALSGLEFEVAQRASGQPIVRISSSVPVSDPALELLIELNWSTGRIIREYTLLLDPPMDGRTAAQNTSVKPMVPEVGMPVARDSLPGQEVKAPPEATRPDAGGATQPDRYGPVRTGETLRAIAGRVRGADVTLEQMMAGLYLSNKSAFIDRNMNLLKKGAVLRIPSADSVQGQTTPGEAVRMLRKHLDEWHAYRGKLAAGAAAIPADRADAATTTGKITPRVEDSVGVATTPKDVLKLSKGEPATAGKADAKVQERMQILEEELAAKSRALQESQDRVSQLERTVQDMQKLLQQKAQEATQPQAPPVPVPAEPPPPEERPAVEATPMVKPVPPVPVGPPAPVEEEGGWLGTFLKNPIYIGGLVAAGLLSGLLWMMMMGNRRRQGLNKFEDSIMTGGDFKSGAVFNTAATAGAATGGTATTEGSMLLTDFSRLGLGAIDTHEVDPIAEAEVYMAYGRDAQAEEILKEALEKDSSRHEVALKLLEIYAARKDPLAFETTASELYAGLGGQDTPVWQRAAEMGRAIDPDNPLYRMAQGQSFAAAEPVVVEAPIPETTPISEAAADQGLNLDTAVADTEAARVPDIALEPSSRTEVEGGVWETPDDHTLDFTPGIEPVSGPQADEPLPASGALHETTIDIDADALSLEFEPEPVVASIAEALPESTEEVPTITLDLDAAAQDMSDEAMIEFQAPDVGAPEEVVVTELVELELPEEAEPTPIDEAMPEIDFSAIDLELGAPSHQEAVPGAEVEEQPRRHGEEMMSEMPELVASTAADSGTTLLEEVETKLDLARAYLEMGDREGAREILHEVLQEGNGEQKTEAEKLLAQAG
ncbi:MAG TPA: FimV/HubP family polar landmark protein [Thiobacillaceae bacterium]|nr:FimV/HubP family polar landmark protein [Thiobacillaceae bacterium]HNU65158.1 FimV/HubP family polar landmark protein [Thiobacillaceae bacterium]